MLRRARHDVAAVGRRERRVLPPRLARFDPAGHAVRIHRYCRARRWLLQWPAGMASAGWAIRAYVSRQLAYRCKGERFETAGLVLYDAEQNAPRLGLEPDFLVSYR